VAISCLINWQAKNKKEPVPISHLIDQQAKKEKRTCMRGMRGADQSFDQSASKQQKRICVRGVRGAN